MDQHLGQLIFHDLLQWIHILLREGKQEITHYSDNITGCGQQITTQIQQEFFKIVQSILLMVKQTKSDEQLKLLLKGLVWDFKSYDMSYLVDLDVLGVLS